MKLSMWMIANRLKPLNPEFQISDGSPAVLKSARRAYATNCVYVFPSGNDVICQWENDTIRLKDIQFDEAFEIIQGIFDFYEDWDAAIVSAAEQGDYQKILDESWHCFHNPMVLLDANCNVLAYSQQYKEVYVDEEWAHLMEYGCSSIDSIRFMRRDCTDQNFLMWEPPNIILTGKHSLTASHHLSIMTVPSADGSPWWNETESSIPGTASFWTISHGFLLFPWEKQGLPRLRMVTITVYSEI